MTLDSKRSNFILNDKMQVNTSKYILLTILILISATFSAQEVSKKYVTKTGDTTIVVLAGNRGLRGPNAAFLLDDKIYNEYDSKHSRYRMLRDAAQETEQVSSIVEVEKNRANPTSGSLSFRIAKQNLDYLRRDQEAQKTARSNLNNRDASVEELTYLYEKFGNQPSYFVNGIHVDKKTADALSTKDVLTRSHKVMNTATGNPNGEVWYVVNSATFNKLNIDPNVFAESYAENTVKMPTGTSYQPRDTQQSTSTSVPAQTSSDDFWGQQEKGRTTYSSQQQAGTAKPSTDLTLSAQQRELEELQQQLRSLQERSGGVNQQIAGSSTNSYRESATQSQQRATQQARKPRQEPEIVSFKDSPQERSRRERDLFEQQQRQQQEPIRERDEVIVVSNQAADGTFTDPNITKDTPVRSVRRIKDRERKK